MKTLQLNGYEATQEPKFP